MTQWLMREVGVVESCFKEKFGIPRQPGLSPTAPAIIRLHPPYDDPDAVRELASFSHIWVLFAFHATAGQGWRPTVRPPKLGGNARVGVFASRSPFRPNPIGMSVVRLTGITTDSGTRLAIAGGDLLDGTPVLDIKPYLRYADAVADASGAYDANAAQLAVRFATAAESDLMQWQARYPALRALIIEVLAQDPRPGYADDCGRTYGMVLYEFNVTWHCADGIAQVERVLLQ